MLTIEQIKQLGRLSRALRAAWTADTASRSWDGTIPSHNQCAASALIVQDIFGGVLLRCPMTDGDSHYWNRLPDGNDIDMTSEQFEYIEPQPLREQAEEYSRQYVLSFTNTMRRYGILSQRVARALEQIDGIQR